MSTELTNTNDWRQAVEDEAQRLEAGAGLMRILAMADDQIDAIRVASDLMAAAWHCDKARAARERGQPAPNAPIPVSKLLTRFADSLREKFTAVAALLPHEYRERLLAVAPAAQASLEAQERDVIDLIVKFLPAPPDTIAFAIIFCIDAIERRFAS